MEAVAQNTRRSGASICDGTTSAQGAKDGPEVGREPHQGDESRPVSHKLGAQAFGPLYATATMQRGSGPELSARDSGVCWPRRARAIIVLLGARALTAPGQRESAPPVDPRRRPRRGAACTPAPARVFARPAPAAWRASRAFAYAAAVRRAAASCRARRQAHRPRRALRRHGDDLRGERVRGRGSESLAEGVDEGVGAGGSVEVEHLFEGTLPYQSRLSGEAIPGR
jgi:hypothetical protein